MINKINSNKINLDEKILLNVQEVCQYTGIGETKVRQLLNKKDSTYTIRLGNKLYANKKLLEQYLEKCAKYQIPI